MFYLEIQLGSIYLLRNISAMLLLYCGTIFTVLKLESRPIYFCSVVQIDKVDGTLTIVSDT